MFDPKAILSLLTPDQWTAAGTVAIAGFTIVLAFVGVAQAILTRQAINLARAEFNATHRPRIIVRNFQIDQDEISPGKLPCPLFYAQNIGDSTATIIEVRSATLIFNAGEPLPNDLSFPFKENFNVTLEAGARELFAANGGTGLTDQDVFGLFQNTFNLYALGTVTYIDSSKTVRETGFCRRYIHRERRWEIAESEYDYAY